MKTELANCWPSVSWQLADSIFWELFFTFTPFCFIFAFFVFFVRLKKCQWHKCLRFNPPNCLSFLVCQYPPIISLKYHTKWSEWWVSESFTNRREKPKLLWKQIFNFLWHFSFLFFLHTKIPLIQRVTKCISDYITHTFLNTLLFKVMIIIAEAPSNIAFFTLNTTKLCWRPEFWWSWSLQWSIKYFPYDQMQPRPVSTLTKVIKKHS